MTPQDPQYRYFSFGFIGVDLFFVISGFLIGRMLVKELTVSGGVNFRAFYRRRLLRILPLYWFVTVATFVFWIPIQHHSSPGPGILLKFLTLDFFFLHTLGRFNELCAWGSWSLAIEEWFYALAPFVLFAGYRLLRGKLRNLRWMVLGLLIGGYCIRAFLVSQSTLTEPTDLWMLAARPYCRFDELLIGVFIGLLQISDMLPTSVHAKRGCLAFAGASIALGFLLTAPHNFFGNYACSPLFFALGFGALVAGFYEISWTHPIIQITAKLSYSLYLIHFLPRLLVPSAPAWGVPLILLATVMVSYLASLLIEFPFLRLYRAPATARPNRDPQTLPVLASVSTI